MTFGRWQKLPAATVPRRRGVLQARASDALVAYPTGKSAMVYYDADEDLAQALARLGAAVPPGADVLVRFAECAEPARELAAAAGRLHAPLRRPARLESARLSATAASAAPARRCCRNPDRRRSTR